MMSADALEPSLTSAEVLRMLSIPTALIATALTALTASPALASVHTRAHRFAPADHVSVSFELPRHPARGTLVRLARNRLVVTRGRSGALALRTAAGARSRKLGAPRRGTRVRLGLSAARAETTLTAGARSATLRGPFVAEDAVIERGVRAVVRHVRRATVIAPAATASSQTAASPRPVAAVTPVVQPPQPVARAGSRLFAATSVWNTPLPDNAPLDPAGKVLVKSLNATVAQNIAAGWGPWIETTHTSSFYVVPADQPTVRVTLLPGSWKVGLQRTFEAVPIPKDARPAEGPDAHLTVYQPATDRLWEFFRAAKLADGWHAAFGGSFAH